MIPDKVPAYITWERYLANQERLAANRCLPTAVGVPRGGPSLLSGLVYCGRCGRRMQVAYHAKGAPVYYRCQTRSVEYGEPFCQSSRRRLARGVGHRGGAASPRAGQAGVVFSSRCRSGARTAAAGPALAKAAGTGTDRGPARGSPVPRRRARGPLGGPRAGAALGAGPAGTTRSGGTI